MYGNAINETRPGNEMNEKQSEWEWCNTRKKNRTQKRTNESTVEWDDSCEKIVRVYGCKFGCFTVACEVITN